MANTTRKDIFSASMDITIRRDRSLALMVSTIDGVKRLSQTGDIILAMILALMANIIRRDLSLVATASIPGRDHTWGTMDIIIRRVLS